MNSYKDLLEQFIDIKLSRDELYKLLPKDKKLHIDKSVEISADRLINLLEKFKEGIISEQTILDWVNTIWFNDWFDYSDKYSDSIASVMNELEEIDEEGKKLSLEKIERYINALKKNIEV